MLMFSITERAKNNYLYYIFTDASCFDDLCLHILIAEEKNFRLEGARIFLWTPGGLSGGISKIFPA